MRTYQTRRTLQERRRDMYSGAILTLGILCSWIVMATLGYVVGLSLCV